MRLLLIISTLLQALYLILLPISFEGDAGGYLRYAQFLAGNGGEFQYFRPPGFPMYLHLVGTTWAESFYGVIAANALMGIAMPLLVYGILKPVGRLALVAAAIFALSTIPFSYAKVLITEHPYSFFLLLGTFGLSRFVYTQKAMWAWLCMGALFIALMMRNEALWVAIVAVVGMLVVAGKKRNVVLVSCLAVALLTVGWVEKRSAWVDARGLHNFSGRQMYWRINYSFGRQFVDQVNGPRSEQLEKIFPGLIAMRDESANWTLGTEAVKVLGVEPANALFKDVVKESVRAHPEIIWRIIRSGFGYLGYSIEEQRLIWARDVYEKMPFNIGNAAKYSMSPRLYAQYTRSQSRKSKGWDRVHAIGQHMHNLARLLVGTILLSTFWGLFFTRHRSLAVFVFLTVGCLISAAMAGFGFNVRYEHSILPFLMILMVLGIDGLQNRLKPTKPA